jgi:HK97 family phage portal protein
MGILDLFRSKSAAVSAPRADAQTLETFDLTDPRLLDFMRGRYISSESGAVITPESAMRVATAYRCESIITDAVATLPMDLKRRISDRRKDASNSSLWKVLRKKPNPWQTPSEFKRLMQSCVLLRGNGYALIVRSFGEVTGLIPLIGAMEVKQNADLSLSYFYTRPGDGVVVPIPQQDMFHLRGKSMNGITGMSVIGYARESLGLSIQSEKHAAKMFKNGTSIAGVIQHPKNIGETEIERLHAELEKFRGSENAYKNLVLENGMTYNKIDLSAVDLQFIQNREMTQTEVAMFFGVPPFMLGLTNKTTSWGAGIEQQGIGFVAYTLQPWLTMWQEAIERDLIPDSEPRMYCRINPAGLIRGDIKTRYAAYAVGRMWGWLSANDVREKEDMDDIEDGDIYIVPANEVPANKLGSADPADATGGALDDPNETDPSEQPEQP